MDYKRMFNDMTLTIVAIEGGINFIQKQFGISTPIENIIEFGES